MNMQYVNMTDTSPLQDPTMCITGTSLQTLNSWPITGMVEVETLVNAGFFYTGICSIFGIFFIFL